MYKTAVIAALFASTIDATRIRAASASKEDEAVDGATALAAQDSGTADVDPDFNSQYEYDIEDQNFNGILGMLGTPSSMTTQLHTMFNQIHFNERVMRQIRQIVNESPELQESLCAKENELCECPVGNNIIYAVQTPEGKMDYMLGFSQDIATTE